jgi:hypothetical protein
MHAGSDGASNSIRSINVASSAGAFDSYDHVAKIDRDDARKPWLSVRRADTAKIADK